MSEQIVNANFHAAGVTSGKRLMVDAVGYEMDLAVSLEKAMAFTLSATVTPTGAGDYFAKLANLSGDYKLVITAMRFTDAAAEVISVVAAAEFPSATTHAEVEPINRMVGSTVRASTYGHFEADVDITGIVGGVEVHRCTMAAGGQNSINMNNAPIVLLVNQCVCLLASVGAGALTLEVDFYFAAVPYVNG
jgi:hypothetical protein